MMAGVGDRRSVNAAGVIPVMWQVRFTMDLI